MDHLCPRTSGTGALVVSFFMTPLDVVKIRLQAQERLYSKKCFLYSNGIMDHLCPRTNGDPPPRALHTAAEICDCKWYNRPRHHDLLHHLRAAQVCHSPTGVSWP